MVNGFYLSLGILAFTMATGILFTLENNLINLFIILITYISFVNSFRLAFEEENTHKIKSKKVVRR
jgi:hypothetical protein